MLAERDAIEMLAAHLPLRTSNLANGEVDEYKALIEKTSARNGELFRYALLTVMSRLAAPWQVIRFGVRAAGSDTAARVAETHYGVAVTIVLAELERMVNELRDDLRSGTGVAVGAALLDGLRHAGEVDRSFRQSQVDAAVRFCAKVFGQDYAALLTKAAEVAGAAECKPARAGAA